MKCCDSRTRSSAARISSRMPAYCAFRSSRGMIPLQRSDVQAFAPNRAYAIDRGSSARDGGDAGYMMIDGRAPNRHLVKEGFAAERRVNDEIHLAALDVVHNMRPAFVHFVHCFDLDARTPQHPSGSARRDDLETDLKEICDDP